MFGLSRKWQIVIFASVVLFSLTYYISVRQIHLSRERRELRELDANLESIVKENEKLKQEIQDQEIAILQKKVHADLEKWAADERKLSFKSPVVYQQMTREALREYIHSKIGEQYSAEEFRCYELGLKRIGLLPFDLDLMKSLSDLLTEQIAAFYDPESHKLYTFKESGVDSNLDRMVLAHELIHALQDQNYDLNHLNLHEKENDDQTLAASSVLEGDATFHMVDYLKSEYQATQVVSDLKFLGSQDHQKLEKAPVYLRESLLFPYESGLNFIQALSAAGGIEKINLLYTDPPKSSEQILHPAKYLASVRDDPKPVILNLKLPEGWKKTQENVMGEFGVRVLFEKNPPSDSSRALANRVGEGWGGDRYVMYDGPKGQWILVWKTVWDSEKDAREFFDALEEYYQDQYQLKTGKTRLSQAADAVFFTDSGQKQNITKKGSTVIFISAPALPVLKNLIEQVAGEK